VLGLNVFKLALETRAGPPVAGIEMWVAEGGNTSLLNVSESIG